MKEGIKEGITYFPLDCHLDEKFDLIEAEYGLKAFSVVVKLFQRIYGGHGYYCEWNEDIALLFARQKCLSSSDAGNNLIADIVAASIRRGIFSKELYEKYGVLTSRGIQKRYLDIVYKRKAVKMEKAYLLLSDAEIKGNVVLIDHSDDRMIKNDVRIEQSKVKQSKKNTNVFFVANGEPPATPPRKLIPEDSFEMRCVNCLIDALVKNMPGAKVPKTAAERQKWAVEIEKMKRIDKRSEEEIQEALNYAVTAPFWKTNIRSTGKFRKQFETLLLQSRQRTDRNRQQAAPKNRFHNLEEHGYDYDKMVWDMANRSGLG